MLWLSRGIFSCFIHWRECWEEGWEILVMLKAMGHQPPEHHWSLKENSSLALSLCLFVFSLTSLSFFTTFGLPFPLSSLNIMVMRSVGSAKGTQLTFILYYEMKRRKESMVFMENPELAFRRGAVRNQRHILCKNASKQFWEKEELQDKFTLVQHFWNLCVVRKFSEIPHHIKKLKFAWYRSSVNHFRVSEKNITKPYTALLAYQTGRWRPCSSHHRSSYEVFWQQDDNVQTNRRAKWSSTPWDRATVVGGEASGSSILGRGVPGQHSGQRVMSGFNFEISNIGAGASIWLNS